MSPNTLIVLLGLLMLAVGSQAGFDFVLLGLNMIVGALIGALLAHFFAVSDWQVALLVAGVLSLVYVLYARAFIRDRLSVTSQKTNIDKLYGQQGKVVTSIAPFRAGQVSVSGEIWRAESTTPLEAETTVTVERVEGITLRVKPLAPGRSE